ncbi:MAG: hypothetical protein L0H41_00555 [Microlunatus sp.]|nr:hypothetical protein [Microlunatus sp.]MDN5770312.1 hypothetical protein [Microlunatus sp.]MDN5803270.1 hypothetical protein [Microlunatus sp.]
MSRALQPILFSYQPDQEAMWIDAVPFRAHLVHLLAAGLTEAVIARMSGLSTPAVRHLAHGRWGRPVRRVPIDTARRLLRITTAEARAVRVRLVPVHPTRQRLREMVAAGWTLAALADELAVSIRELEPALGRGSSSCSQLLRLKVAAAYERWDRSNPDQLAAA